VDCERRVALLGAPDQMPANSQAVRNWPKGQYRSGDPRVTSRADRLTGRSCKSLERRRLLRFLRIAGPSVPRAERYQQIAERFEEAARASLGRLSYISEICDAIGVTQRTLTRVVRAVHGITPSQYVRMLRLTEAKRVLSSPRSRTETVTDVAIRCGFRQLSRFAADYRAAFGESPSETLRRASGSSSDPETDARGHGALVCARAGACQHRDMG
jgi:AraC-like DNA-binding protein